MTTRTRMRCFERALHACALLLLACADDASRRCEEEPCPSACDDLTVGSCDVLKASCRRRILNAVICVRGTPGVAPHVRTLTEDEYRRELEGDAGADGGRSDDADDAGARSDAAVPTREAASPHWDAALKLLGLLDPEVDSETASIDEAVGDVSGFYDPRTHDITLIDRGMRLDSDGSMHAMAHELVHALQDQEVGLTEAWDRAPGSMDGRFAHGCLVEGDAELYAQLAWARLQGVALRAVDWDTSLSWSLKYARRDVVQSASPYLNVWQLRYPVGERYVLDTWRYGGNWQVRSLYEAPPTSSIHWVVGFEANRARRDHLVVPLACDRAAAPAHYERAGVYSLGALPLFAFLGHVLRDDGRFESEEHWRNVEHWRQDSLALFAGPDGETAVSYRIRFDDERLAEEIADALRAVTTPRLAVRREGAEIEVLAAEDADVLTGWKTDPDACPEPD